MALKILDVKEGLPSGSETPQDPWTLYKTCLEMQTLCDAAKGIGLAAVQVGLPWRLFVIKKPMGYEFYCDCIYEGIGDKQPSIEGCLSIRNDGNLVHYKLDRYSSVKVKGKKIIEGIEKPEIVEFDCVLDGTYAIVFQHEIDHGLDILISDIGEPIQLF